MNSKRSLFPAFVLITIFLSSCYTSGEKSQTATAYSDVRIASAMRNVMWKGELDGKIRLDTITDREGLYGLGPLSFLQGEILISNGQTYVSRVTSDSTMSVDHIPAAAAPFFVYANVREWKETALPDSIRSIEALEKFIDQKTRDFKRPFAFKLMGKVNQAKIHIQNLPSGTSVSSPQEAHQGQVNYTVKNEVCEIIGFFSTGHQGIFTHHDSYLHMHLITEDQSKMGHLDEVDFGAMKLFLPVR